MTQYCQNGYPVLSADDPLLKPITIPGTGRRLTLSFDAGGFLLALFAYQFNDFVEAINPPGNEPVDEGGYNVRPIAGTNVWSNHSGGKAIDLNWNEHRYGATDSFTTAEVYTIHKLLSLYDGCLRWGGDYHSKKDSMHTEVIANRAACIKVAKRMRYRKRGRALCKANPGLWRAIGKS